MSLARFRPLIASLLLAATCLPAAAQFVPGELTDDQVQTAIKQYKDAILRAQGGNGEWPCAYANNHEAIHGGTILAVLSLLVSGESMQRKEIDEALEQLKKAELKNLYEVALRAHVWSYLPPEYLPFLQKDCSIVLGTKGDGPFWGKYTPAGGGATVSGEGGGGTRDDMSLSQYAWLALWQGRKRGVTIPTSLWDMAANHLIKRQLPDGGWGYYASDIPTQKMTCAAMAVLYVAQQERDRGKPKPDPAITKALDKGWEFLEKNMKVENIEPHAEQLSGYQYYGYERVCLAGGRLMIQGKDWFKHIGGHIITKDQPTQDVCNNAFKLMFLARGSVPVWCNKIQLPGTDSWRNRPNDIYFVNKWLSEQRESELNWVIQHIDDKSDYWLNAPVAYLSLEDKPNITDVEKENLRSYIDHGGLLLLNAEGDSAASSAIAGLARDLYPKYTPSAPLPGSVLMDGAVAAKPGAAATRAVGGAKVIHNGARELIILLDGDSGFTWQKDEVPDKSKPAWQLAWNIYQMATDKGQLTNRLVSPFEMPRNTASKAIQVVVPTYKGNCQPEAKPYDIMNFYLCNRTSMGVQADFTQSLASIGGSTASLIHIQGTDKPEFTQAELEAVKTFAENGGTVLFETVGGHKGPKGFFASEAQAMMEKLMNTSAETVSSKELIEGSSTDGSTSVERALYRRATVEAGQKGTKIKVQAIKVKGREAILFSNEDLTLGMNRCRNYGINGYAPDTAQKFMLNLLVDADKHKPSAATAPAAAPAAAPANPAPPTAPPAEAPK